MNDTAKQSLNAPPLNFAAALDTRAAGRAWGCEAARLNFHVTIPAGREGAIELRDELVSWLQRRGLNLALTSDGLDSYLTWPAPRVCPDIPPLPDGCPSVFPARTEGGPPVYGKPTIIALTCTGNATADCGDVTIGFALTDNDDARTCGIYNGTIPQETLFRVMHDAGLITRRGRT